MKEKILAMLTELAEHKLVYIIFQTDKELIYRYTEQDVDWTLVNEFEDFIMYAEDDGLIETESECTQFWIMVKDFTFSQLIDYDD
jgi:hypothetical protein